MNSSRKGAFFCIVVDFFFGTGKHDDLQILKITKICYCVLGGIKPCIPTCNKKNFEQFTRNVITDKIIVHKV